MLTVSARTDLLTGDALVL